MIGCDVEGGERGCIGVRVGRSVCLAWDCVGDTYID